MLRRKCPESLERAILEMIRENGGSLSVELDGDYTPEFMALLEQLAGAGTIEVGDDDGSGGQTFRLPEARAA